MDDDDVPPGVRRALDKLEKERTPPLGVAIDSSFVERVYEIAEAVVKRSRAGEWVDCEGKGPACKLAARVTEVEKSMEAIKDVLAEARGQAKFKTLLIAIIGVALTATSVGAAIWGQISKHETATQTAQIMTDLTREIRALRAEVNK